jgi:hypothetical protein
MADKKFEIVATSITGKGRGARYNKGEVVPENFLLHPEEHLKNGHIKEFVETEPVKENDKIKNDLPK